MNLFAPWDDRWLIHRDEQLVVVNKPVGMPTQSARDEGEDLARRVKEGLALSYLATHQRLDAETSGVIAYGLAKGQVMARAFADATKEYLTIVEAPEASECAWQALRSPASQQKGGAAKRRRGQRSQDKGLGAGPNPWSAQWRRVEHWLRPEKGGSALCQQRDGGAKRALLEARLLRQEGKRQLLAVRLLTGRTHQIRVQLAALGTPVAGDQRYGGVDAPRLMLHAHRLTLGGRTYEAPLPATFEGWLEGARPSHGKVEPSISGSARDSFAFLEGSLRQAAHRRWGLWHAPDTTAFRLLHGDAEGLPGVSLDVYGRHLLLHLHSDEARARADALAERVWKATQGTGFEGLYIKRRPRQSNLNSSSRSSNPRSAIPRSENPQIQNPKGAVRPGEETDAARPVLTAEERAPSKPLWGEDVGAFEIQEHGMRFGVHLGDGMSTGIFLDQRQARAKVRAASAGRRVINLFAYTCPFGVAAALGGASEVVNVDASGVALGRGKENFARNGVEGRVLKADAFEYLERAVRNGHRYDLVICDPPTYATGKKGKKGGKGKKGRQRWKSGKQWVGLAAQCAAIAAPGGTLLLSSNDARMSQGQFRRFVREGLQEAGRAARALRDEKASRDFPAPVGKEPLPHRLWVHLA